MKTTVATLLLTCLLPGWVRAEAVLDQSFERSGGFTSISSATTLEQTFTVGIEGTLAYAELYLRSGVEGQVAPLVDLAIVRATDGMPSFLADDRLTQASSPVPVAPDEPVALKPSRRDFSWIVFDFPGIPVNAGQQLALIVSSEVYHGFHMSTRFQGGGYGGGQGTIGGRLDSQLRYQRDYLFRTYVIPIPEPGALALVSIACAGLLTASHWRSSTSRFARASSRRR